MAGMETVLLGTIPVETELTETYDNEDAGYSFQYPNDWTSSDPELYSDRVELIHNENTTEHRASIVIVSDFVDVLDVFSGDIDRVKSNFTEDGVTFLSLEDAKLGGIPAKKLTYKSNDFLSGKDNIVTTFYYKQGEAVNWVEFSCAEDTVDLYGPVFDAITDSYTIITPEPTPTPAPTPVPPPSAQYATIDDFLENPEVEAKLQEMLDQVDGISTTLSISYTEETLFFEYQYTESGAFGVPENLLANSAKEKVDAMRSTYEELAEKLCEIADIDNPMVIVQYLTPYDDELYYIEFPGE